MRLDDLRPNPLFNGLTDDQLGELLGAGEEVRFDRGDIVFREGEHADSWWVLVDGSLELVRHLGREDVVVGRMAVPGVWSGGFRAWDENGVYLATGRGEGPGRMLRVPSESLRTCLDGWFPFGVHLINGLYGTARSIEATARQRDSLVTLGRLSAGLAHELNNPAAAAVRAVAALDTTSTTLLASVRWLAEDGISAEKLTALDALRLELADRPAHRDAIELAESEEALVDWLERRDVHRGWELAPALAAAGADPDWCDRTEALLGAALQPGLEWVAATLACSSLIGEVRESTRRVSQLVNAVRSYSQMDRGSRQRTDITEGIESTLVMLGHKIPPDVQVVRDYAADVPPVEVFPGELNQVWTNLVDNALDAMAGSGTLRVATRLDGDDVVVEVGDTGPGMPPEVVACAFEAFFTTKDVGKGTGLGLDIARRIVVDRHDGEIVIHPEPGKTVMEVRLPVGR
ncbi:MAG TPA: ATP-binding protein [Nocardioidaceae bacterium]|nr:ATP-binding protein [Nocardioidaceae bacterium]